MVFPIIRFYRCDKPKEIERAGDSHGRSYYFTKAISEVHNGIPN